MNLQTDDGFVFCLNLSSNIHKVRSTRASARSASEDHWYQVYRDAGRKANQALYPQFGIAPAVGCSARENSKRGWELNYLNRFILNDIPASFQSPWAPACRPNIFRTRRSAWRACEHETGMVKPRK